MDVFDRLAAAPELDPGEWSRTLARVVRSLEVHPDRLVFVPLLGDAAAAPSENRTRTAKTSTEALLRTEP